MIIPNILVRVINTVSNPSFKSDILTGRKKLPYYYFACYVSHVNLKDRDSYSKAYAEYLLFWEMNKYERKHYKQLALEDFND